MFFVVVIVALIGGAMLLGGVVRRSVARSGDRYARSVADDRLDAALRELGATLVVHSSASVASDIVDGVVAADPRRFVTLDDGAYGIRFVHDDDTVMRIVDDPAGSRLEVERSREHLGLPKGGGYWAELRTLVAAAAASRGVSTAPGPSVAFERRELDGDVVEWVRVP